MDEPNDLIAWLRALLDEDERVARAVRDPNWTYRVDPDYPAPDVRVDDYTLWFGDRFACEVGFGEDEIRPSEAKHIALHDPARVLAEVDAKRLLLEECESTIRKSAPRSNLNDLAWTVIRSLTPPFAGRPGYREEWRP